MRYIKILAILIIIFSFLVLVLPKKESESQQTSTSPVELKRPVGVWVTVFSKENVLYSKEGADNLIAFCRKHGIDEIYLQVYRSGQAYYDSAFLGDDKYQAMLKGFGQDPIDYILQAAQGQNIRVFAWINVLSLAQNKKAPIARKFGSEVFTRDKSGRFSIRTEGVDHSDMFYLRDDQIFLEPGDERVVAWTLDVTKELAQRYPSLSGLHLDYIRYPYPVPYVPDSRFVDYGVTYGFGERNVVRFQQVFKKNPGKDDMYAELLYLNWDNWKREQVTGIVSKVRDTLKKEAPAWLLSCAVVATQERAYSIAFQDWPLWLEQGYVDYVVLMNYSKDTRLVQEQVQGALAYRGKGKVYSGLGPFLFKDPAEILNQYKVVEALKPDGIVWFSYDDMTKVLEESKE